MKKITTILATLALFMILQSCGGKGEKKSSVQVSTEMQDFMNNFNGLSASVKYALDNFGAPGLDRKDMDLYNLEKPKVTEANGNCYLMECKSGLTTRKYNVCWESGKINSVEDRGME